MKYKVRGKYKVCWDATPGNETFKIADVYFTFRIMAKTREIEFFFGRVPNDSDGFCIFEKSTGRRIIWNLGCLSCVAFENICRFIALCSDVEDKINSRSKISDGWKEETEEC